MGATDRGSAFIHEMKSDRAIQTVHGMAVVLLALADVEGKLVEAFHSKGL